MIPEFTSAAELMAHYKAIGIGRKPRRVVVRPAPIPAPTLVSQDRGFLKYKKVSVRQYEQEKKERAEKLQQELREAEATKLAESIRFSIARITAVVCSLKGVGELDVKGPSRSQSLVTIRQAIWCIAYKHTFMSFAQMGIPFKRDHSTVMHGICEGWNDTEIKAFMAKAEVKLGFPETGVRDWNKRHGNKPVNQYTYMGNGRPGA